MRAGNFHPEWGVLAPAPNFSRKLRMIITATAVGALAGAGVALSLSERPPDAKAVARTLPPVEAASNVVNTPLESVQSAVQMSPLRAADSSAHQLQPQPTAPAPKGVAVSADAPAVLGDAPAKTETLPSPSPAIAAPVQKKVAQRRRPPSRHVPRSEEYASDYYRTTRGLFMRSERGAGFYRGDRWGDYRDGFNGR
jgi:hypothetical protein